MQLWEIIGVITKAQEASFRQEMAEIRERVDLKLASCTINGDKITDYFTQVKLDDTENWDKYLKFEIVYWGDYEIGYQVSKVKREYAMKQASKIIEDSANANEGNIPDLYFIDKDTARKRKCCLCI